MGDKRKFAGAIIVLENGEVALQQRDDKPSIENPGRLGLFGGAVEAGETPAEAVIRELKEELELGLEEDDLVFWGEFEKTAELHGSDWDGYIFILEGAEKDDLKIREGKKIVYITSVGELDSYDVAPYTKELVVKYLEDHES